MKFYRAFNWPETHNRTYEYGSTQDTGIYNFLLFFKCLSLRHLGQT